MFFISHFIPNNQSLKEFTGSDDAQVIVPESPPLANNPSITTPTPKLIQVPKHFEDISPTGYRVYQGNQGDSRIEEIGNHIDLYHRTYNNGLWIWLARWNTSSEKSWVHYLYSLKGEYEKLSGEILPMDCYNTDNYNVSLEFISNGNIIKSYELTPDSAYPIQVDIEIGAIDDFEIYVYDNKAVPGGTAFGIVNFTLNNDTSNDSTPLPPPSPEVRADPVAKLFEGIKPTGYRVYQGNQGDSRIEEIGDHIDLYHRTHNNGLWIWLARWNTSSEKSWVHYLYNLNEEYTRLSGEIIPMDCYNKDNYDVCLEFKSNGNLIKSFVLSPDAAYPLQIDLDVYAIDDFEIFVYDNKAVPGGTAFGIVNLILEKVDFN